MKTPIIAGLSMIVGAIIGARAIQALHAQVKPPRLCRHRKNQEGFAKQYIPLALKALRSGSLGYKVLARNGKTVALDGETPQKWVIINEFTDLDHPVLRAILQNITQRGRSDASMRIFECSRLRAYRRSLGCEL